MKVYELVTTCQNQWKGNLFDKNENFRLEITIENTTYIFSANYGQVDDYLNLSDLSVSYWRMKFDEKYSEYTLKIRVKA